MLSLQNIKFYEGNPLHWVKSLLGEDDETRFLHLNYFPAWSPRGKPQGPGRISGHREFTNIQTLIIILNYEVVGQKTELSEERKVVET